MREIKFRGIKTNTKSWVYGSLIRYRSGKVLIIGDIHERAYEVDPETVGQYTGMKDESKKEVYEGDFVEFIDGSKKEVVWSDDFYDFRYDDLSLINDRENYCGYKRVCGNRFDNPELLK